MTKRKKLFLAFSFVLLPILLIALLYSFPIFLEYNPFYTITNPESSLLEYEKFSLTPMVNANIPKGWSVKTTNYRSEKNPYGKREVVTGNLTIAIYKGRELVASLTAVTGLGGGGGVFYKFPDSKTEEVEAFRETMLEAHDEWGETELYRIEEIKEGEYTEIKLFGLRVRRVKGRYGPQYLPNTNKVEDGHFTAPTNHPIYFFAEDFKDNGPNHQIHYYNNAGELTDEWQGSAYQLHFNNECEQTCSAEENLLIVDSILNSMEFKK